MTLWAPPGRCTSCVTPTVHPLGEHDFRTPILPIPVIERTAFWPETSQSRQELLTRAEAHEAGVS
jgi:hypothetical protein